MESETGKHDGAAQRYHGAAMLVHWTTAAFVIGLIVSGLTLDSFPPGDPRGPALLQWHASFGLSVLALTIVRLALRVALRPPPLPAGMPGWERLAARLSHGLFYALLVLTPLSGWVVVSVAPNAPALQWFGLVDFPTLPPPPGDQGAVVAERVMRTHELLATIMIGLLALHVFAAARHALVLKDAVMARMIPGRN